MFVLMSSVTQRSSSPASEWAGSASLRSILVPALVVMTVFFQVG